MWNPFKKNEDDVVDFTALERRGVMRKSRELQQDSKVNNLNSNDVIDLTSSNTETSSSVSDNNDSTGLGFLGSIASSSSDSSSVSSDSDSDVDTGFSSYLSPDEKRKKLARRLSDMTGKIESHDTELYRLQQRIELLERKLERQ